MVVVEVVVVVHNICDTDTLIRALPTNSPSNILHNHFQSEVIGKSITDPDNNFQRNSPHQRVK